MSDAVNNDYAEPIVKAILLGNESGLISQTTKSHDEGASHRIKGSNRFSSIAGELEPPPFDVEAFARTTELNTRLSRCINLVSTNTVGLGWKIVPKKNITDQTPLNVKRKIEQEKDLVESLLLQPNNEMPFTTLMKVVIFDREVVGNGYLEVVRNQDTSTDPLGQIISLWHVQAKTVRIRKNGDGFVQIKAGKKRYFKNFEDDRVISVKTGKEADGPLPVEERAHELVHFKIYSPSSDFYGVPRYLAASPAIAGTRLSAIRNVSFFENDTVPRGMLLVSGGRVANDSIGMIRDFFDFKARGPDKAHRVAIVQVDAKRSGMGTASKTEIEWVPLTVGVTEDASFRQYAKDGNEEIREAWGIAQVFFNEADTPRAAAIAGRAMTNEQVFMPEQKEIEFIINNTIIRSFGVSEVEFKFLGPQLVDPSEQAKIDQIYGRQGAITPNELRQQRLGLPPYPIDAELGDLPIQLEIVRRQLSAARGESAADPVPPSMGQMANEPPGGAQDLDRELGRELNTVFGMLKKKFGDNIVIKENGQSLLDDLEGEIEESIEQTNRS